MLTLNVIANEINYIGPNVNQYALIVNRYSINVNGEDSNVNNGNVLELAKCQVNTGSFIVLLEV